MLSTATEATLAATSLMRNQNAGKFVKADWSIKFSDRTWVLTVKGAIGDDESAYTVSGFLWGADDEDWVVSYSGTGNMGKEPVLINGKATWRYNSKSLDHEAMEFDSIIKIGENSSWGWVRGSEIIIGGVLGGAAGIIAVAGTPAAIITGAAGAVGGASALVSLSDVTREFVQSDDPKPAAPPKPPPVPKKDDILSPTQDRIVVAVGRERILGTGPDETLTITGGVKGNTGMAVIFTR